MSELTTDGVVELVESELSEVQGGIALLVPAVQKVREAAARISTDDGARVIITAG